MKGIQTIKRKTKHGVRVLYRVQIKNKEFQQDKAFHSYEEAKEFLLASKSRTLKTLATCFQYNKMQKLGYHKSVRQ